MSAGSDLLSDRGTAAVRVTARGEHRVRTGHLWVSRADVDEVAAAAGDVVRLVGPRGRVLGYGLFSDRSAVAVRLLSRARPPDDALWGERLDAAVRYRRSLVIDATQHRVVHAEGDLLPSLVVDRYADVLVVQALSQGVDRHLALIRDLLVERVRPRGILARHDAHARALEGLSRRVEVIFGDVPREVEVVEGRLRLVVDPWAGQSTGSFLDQRETREAVAVHARGRALDCFCYTGGFALRLAGRCDEVVAVDVSPDAVAQVARHAALNGFPGIRPLVGDAFEVLREMERTGERFDTVVLDPPPLERGRSAMAGALAGYTELNQRALTLLTPGGTLVTCCRSPRLDEAEFTALVAGAAHRARARVLLLETRLQSRDHPILLSVPETSSLRCLVVRRLA